MAPKFYCKAQGFKETFLFYVKVSVLSLALYIYVCTFLKIGQTVISLFIFQCFIYCFIVQVVSIIGVVFLHPDPEKGLTWTDAMLALSS